MFGIFLSADPLRRAALVRAAPFLAFIALLAIRGLLASGATASRQADLPWLYAVQAAVAGIALYWWRGQYVELKEPPPSTLGILLSVGAGLAVFLLWIAPMPGWAHLGASVVPFQPVDAAGSLRWDLVAIRAFGAVLVVPVMEELFWRSFLMRWIDKRDFLGLGPANVTWPAVLTSSVVFALAHDLWLAGLVAGLVYALLYRRLASLWYPIAAHATTNLALAAWVLWSRAWQYW